MPDITVAADEIAATELVHDAEATLGTIHKSGLGSLGPFTTSWSAGASFSDGTVDLIAPDVFRIANCRMNYALNFSLSFDLSSVLLDFCLPRVCIPTPWGDICTPRICINWPTITIPVSYADSLTFTADFTLNPHLVGSDWLIDIVVVGVPFLQISPAAAAILVAIGVAAGAVLLAIPFIGPFLAAAVVAITAVVGIAGVTGLLGPLLTLFVSGLTFTVYKQPRIFPVLPAASPTEPAVNINLDAITASVVSSNEDEFVIGADIS